MNKKKHIKNNYFIKHLIFLYHVSRGYLFKCGILLGLTIFMDLVQPQIIKEIIDFSIPNKDIKMLITCAFIFLVMSICGNSLNVLLEKDYSTINKKTVIELKNTLINKIENLGVRRHCRGHSQPTSPFSSEWMSGLLRYSPLPYDYLMCARHRILH